MAKTGLTQKQKNFCHAYARCNNATQAYLEAYDTESEENAKRQGSVLLRRDDITEYLKEINKPTINTIVNEREKKREILWSFINDTAKSDNDRLKAMDLLNKMDAEYVNINRNIDDSSEKLSGLTKEQLKQLIGPTEK